jgi:hypothetical protein
VPATADFDTESLLPSRRIARVRLEPFCFFSVDDYLPADLYETLQARYPAGTEYSSNPEGKLGFRSSVDPEGVDRFCAEEPLWGRLVRFFRSDEFLEDLRRTLAEPLRRARPGWPGRRPWYNANRSVPNNGLRYLVQEPVTTTFEFSQLSRDAVVAPHSDAPRKLVTLLLYFRDPEWRDDWGGGTEYYAPLDPVRARSWGATERIPFEEFKSIGSTGYVANRLAGFVRAPNSYHGVLPVTCPAGLSRRAFMINVKRVKWSKRKRL